MTKYIILFEALLCHSAAYTTLKCVAWNVSDEWIKLALSVVSFHACNREPFHYTVVWCLVQSELWIGRVSILPSPSSQCNTQSCYQGLYVQGQGHKKFSRPRTCQLPGKWKSALQTTNKIIGRNSKYWELQNSTVMLRISSLYCICSLFNLSFCSIYLFNCCTHCK